LRAWGQCCREATQIEMYAEPGLILEGITAKSNYCGDCAKIQHFLGSLKKLCEIYFPQEFGITDCSFTKLSLYSCQLTFFQLNRGIFLLF
jgi:hypothetical protein